MTLQTEQDVKDWIAESDKNINPYTLPEMAFKAGANLILNNLDELPQVRDMLNKFLDSIKDYEHESGERIYSNDKENDELLDIFLSQYKPTAK